MKSLLAASLGLAVLACPAHAALVVSKAATAGVSCASGVCTATQADAVLNDKDFKHLINAGDLTLVSGSAAEDIVFDAKVQWTGAHLLTLDAYRSIQFVLDATSEGAGGVTMLTGDGAGSGTLTFTGKGKLSFWDLSSKLVIDKHGYRLAGDIATLAADIAAKPNGHYALAKGYDASVDGAYASAPIPTTFNGVLEGLGHAIDKLSMAYSNKTVSINFGLFADIGAQGRVRDLYLTNADIEYSSAHTGGNLTGAFAATNAGRLENVAVVTGKVFGQCAGGLAGENDGTIIHSSVTGEVGADNEQAAGGLTCINSGTITQSSVNAEVGAGYGGGTGGLAVSNDGTISLSHAAGRVLVGGATTGNVPDAFAGGVAAFNSGAISQTYSAAVVEGGSCYAGETHSNNAFGGGLVAENTGSVADSYATGATSSANNRGCGAEAGGLVAYAKTGTLARVYSTGVVTCDDCESYQLGGLIGADSVMSNQSAYWDLDASGVTNPSQGAGSPQNDPGITGLSDTALKSALPAGFDPSVWAQSPSINNGWPYLIANPPQ
jgi:hypothetical protein